MEFGLKLSYGAAEQKHLQTFLTFSLPDNLSGAIVLGYHVRLGLSLSKAWELQTTSGDSLGYNNGHAKIRG